ncbi:uncharacterized protein EURHEDRAFT_318407 [Aspergillus ruber CBS 135680]|uniref:Uncharacterized protein n=1 Tax=Aspergillus ruber (strain CBS 135680) TaxID=1388766 RepID=A0A017SJJ5_ASPRC|nr:uncharacterized protein EURHEDRAFT_318407 [Aspergillus ruber CBS 135680]EYE97072.1 hypothetical protein EURHEDRAFT_318407 [Aspergillus ruber CBS 135680]
MYGVMRPTAAEEHPQGRLLGDPRATRALLQFLAARVIARLQKLDWLYEVSKATAKQTRCCVMALFCLRARAIKAILPQISVHNTAVEDMFILIQQGRSKGLFQGRATLVHIQSSSRCMVLSPWL